MNMQKNSTYHKIEKLLNNMIAVELLPKEIQNFFLDVKNGKTFKFKKLIKILVSKEEYLNTFNKFSSVGVLKFKKGDENVFLQVLLKLKVKSLDNNFKSFPFQQNPIQIGFFNRKNFDVKIDGLFLDVTQSYLKKETQINSLILAKYIHDIKSPLFLLERMVISYRDYLKKLFR